MKKLNICFKLNISMLFVYYFAFFFQVLFHSIEEHFGDVISETNRNKEINFF